jgi:GNAT superfamily N-acetyltransferase
MPEVEDAPLHCDLALARRLELTEGHSSSQSVEARAALFPESGAAWVEIGGALAMFDGVASPLTQTFGLGLAGLPSGADMDTIEEFFRERGAPVFHEVSPLAGPELLAVLNDRGYQAFECTSVLVRRIGPTSSSQPNGRISVRLVGPDGPDEWSATSARGWGEFPELAGFLAEIGPITALRRGAHRFLADLDGKPVAAGLLSIRDDVALLAGASTVPEARRQGAQLTLLDARLGFAAARGCTVAMMCALPGSSSQRNAERHGFRVAYTRIKWRLARVG